MVKTNLPSEIVTAAATMLSRYIPWLTPDALQKALETYNPNATSEKDSRPLKPLTRKKAAEELGVSVPTVDRYTASGRLERVTYSARAVRISAESVYNLMKGGK